MSEELVPLMWLAVTCLSAAVAILGFTVWLFFDELKKSREFGHRNFSLYLDQLGKTDEIRDRLEHHLVTFRRDGFSAQPVDEAWESHMLTPEMEADIERERTGG